MQFLQSEQLSTLLLKLGVITQKQKEFIEQERSKQRHKLLRQAAKEGIRDKNYPDMVDIISSLKLTIQNSKRAQGRPIDEELIMRAVAKEKKLPFRKLDPLELDMEVATTTVSKNFAILQSVLPLKIENGIMEMAVYNPDCQVVLDDIEKTNQIKITPILATRSDIRRIINEFFGFQRSISAAEDQFSLDKDGDSSLDISNLERFINISNSQEITSSDQHIKRAVNHLFHYALDQRASDIHIEPKRELSLVRFRIDGLLHTIYRLPKAVHSALVSRIKFLARLDIAEKRRPQDGRIKIGAGSTKEVEIRLSTIPVSFGEKVVMRILDSDVMFRNIDEMGFNTRDLKIYKEFMHAPHGIILVTGPTGSGKSTTLYSTLKEIATPEKNVITVEDPVEMVHEEFNQISVQPAIDVTFASILRNILRQDPDIIMIGEIRDEETAAYAVQAAMTGHLVFSTLHTNDAASSVIRLRDLGLQPFLIASTLLGCMAQRLVKTICPACKEQFKVQSEEMARIGFPVQAGEELILSRGKGCENCRGTGYKGRCGIFEVLPLSSTLKEMIATKNSSLDMKKIAIQEGMTTLRQDAWQKVLQGITTWEEVLRVTSQ